MDSSKDRGEGEGGTKPSELGAEIAEPTYFGYVGGPVGQRVK